jgi:CobQ-like glutamine amidotransferase family enzyme
MIRLLSLYPDRLNLNGDQANLLVLRRRLEARGIPYEVLSFQIGDPVEKIATAGFVLIGHGSMAAWASLRTELLRINETLRHHFEGGCAMLAIGTGAEFLYSAGWFESDLQNRARQSKFVVEEFEGQRVLGYLNSATDMPPIQRRNNLILTALHGPVLAKNPQLADRLLAQSGVQAKDLAMTPKLSVLEAPLEQIWRLEEQLANE